MYSCELIRAVKEIRENDPSYSAKKIRPIILRSNPRFFVPSVSTIARLIRRENFYFRADTKRRRKKSYRQIKVAQRKRKPYDLKPNGARQIIEFDMKHIYLMGQKRYAFCAIDPLTKESVIHVASTPSSLNAKNALAKVIERFGKGISIVNDNGSENMGDAETYLRETNIPQYWTRPNSPKEKPFVERLIGTLQRECLDYNYAHMSLAELDELVNEWLDKYHYYRPHESLGFLTPAQYCDKIGVTIPHGDLSYK
jgi:putative transposase